MPTSCGLQEFPYWISRGTSVSYTHLHYGDWVTDADMGTIGMVYWEKEEGGANSGYHFSYIGFNGCLLYTSGKRKNYCLYC